MYYTVHGIIQARTLEWVAILFSRGSSQLRDWTQVSHIAGRFFTHWATREAIDLTLTDRWMDKVIGGIIHRIGNIINNIAITSDGDEWELDLLWWSFQNV